jgi:putative PIN family toxin of toxin-antitoxin system
VKVVLDTNVLVSGLLSPYGAPGELLRLVAVGALRLCYDVRILEEYREVLQRPAFPFARDRVDALLAQVTAEGVMVGATPLPAPLPDPDDEAFLAVALAGSARYLVTKNPRHFPSKYRQGMRVVSPGDFLAYYREQAPGRAEGRP